MSASTHDLLLDRYLLTGRADDADLFDDSVQKYLVGVWVSPVSGRRQRRRRDAACELLVKACQGLAFDMVRSYSSSRGSRSRDDGSVQSLVNLAVVESLNTWDESRGVAFRSWFATTFTNLFHRERTDDYGQNVPRSWRKVHNVVRELELASSEMFTKPGDRYSTTTVLSRIESDVRRRLGGDSLSDTNTDESAVHDRMTKDGMYAAVRSMGDVFRACGETGSIDHAEGSVYWGSGDVTRPLEHQPHHDSDPVVGAMVNTLLSLADPDEVDLAHRRALSPPGGTSWRALTADTNYTWTDVRHKVAAVEDLLVAPHAHWCAFSDTLEIVDVTSRSSAPHNDTCHTVDEVLSRL